MTGPEYVADGCNVYDRDGDIVGDVCASPTAAAMQAARMNASSLRAWERARHAERMARPTENTDTTQENRMTQPSPFVRPSEIPSGGDSVGFGDFEGSLVILTPKGETVTTIVDSKTGQPKRAHVVDVDVVEGVAEGTQSKMYNQEKAEFPTRHDLTGQSFTDVWAMSGFIMGDLRRSTPGAPIACRIQVRKRPTAAKPEGWNTYALDEPTAEEMAKVTAFYEKKQRAQFATPASVGADEPPF